MRAIAAIGVTVLFMRTWAPTGFDARIPEVAGTPVAALEVGPSAAATATQPGCASRPEIRGAERASLVPDGEVRIDRRAWRPVRGEVRMVIKSFEPLPAGAVVLTCFRWTGTHEAPFIEVRPDIDLSTDRRLLTVLTQIPDLGTPPRNVERPLPFVPVAELRTIAFADDPDTVTPLRADVVTTVGVTDPLVAGTMALLTIAGVLGALWYAAQRRLAAPGIRRAFWFLRIISTPNGVASLSQLQILVWTIVVAAAAVYVMSLRGTLIEISTGTLVLLGIAGAAGLGSIVEAEARGQRPEVIDARAANAARLAAEAAHLASEAQSATNAAAEAARTGTPDAASLATAALSATLRAAQAEDERDRVPRWSDLVVTERLTSGSAEREVDIARFQMLLFTLIAAVFVLLSVLAAFAIPEIPTGVLALMGISNGVYIGAKAARTSPPG